MIRLLFVCLLASFSMGTLQAQMQTQKNPVRWEYGHKKLAAGEYEITFTAYIDAGWAIYSQKLESDNGPIATAFAFAENEDVELIGEVEERGEKIAGYDDIFEMNVVKYKKRVDFVQRVKFKKKSALEGFITTQACDDKQCLPPMDEPFSLQLQ